MTWFWLILILSVVGQFAQLRYEAEHPDGYWTYGIRGRKWSHGRGFQPWGSW